MPLPETMNVIEIFAPGGPEVLVPASRPVPVPGPADVLIQVAAAGVNRPDVLQRAGHYPPPPGATDLPGLEVAGTVVARGDAVRDLALGDRVCALTPGGGYAQFCLAPAAHCLPVPKDYDMVRAAGLAETAFTVWHNVFQRGGLTAGEIFLVHGGSSGIGTTAIQLARKFGARVFTTAGSPEKCCFCESLGAERAIDYRNEDWPAVLRDIVGRDGVNLILDMVGGAYIQPNLKALALEGRLIMIGFLGGSKAEIDFARMMVRRQTITGSTLRAQSDAAKAAIARELREKVWPLLDSGAVAPVIHETFDYCSAADAHRLMETSAHIGKIILTMPES